VIGWAGKKRVFGVYVCMDLFGRIGIKIDFWKRTTNGNNDFEFFESVLCRKSGFRNQHSIWPAHLQISVM
jgi:hypothetical protein